MSENMYNSMLKIMNFIMIYQTIKCTYCNYIRQNLNQLLNDQFLKKINPPT